MIVAIDKETHDAPGKPTADVAQNHLGAPLHKKHHVPLLVIIRTQRIILRICNEQASLPFLRACFGRNARRMHVKSFCALCKHPRSRPLLRPKPDFGENPLIAADKFAENSAVTLRINRAGKNFHARDPDTFYLGLVSIGRGQFAGVNSGAGEPLRQ